MEYRYLNLEKRNEKNFPNNLKYIIITKPIKSSPKDGKKKVSKEDNEEYNKQLELYNKTISALESNHVNAYNNKISTNDIEMFGVDMLFNGIKDGNRIFYIEPIQSETVRSGYYSYSDSDKYVVSEFNVLKEIKTTDNLLENIFDTYNYFYMSRDIFYKGLLVNESYKETSLELFKKFKEHNIEIVVNDLISPKSDLTKYIHSDSNIINFYDNKKAYDYIIELLDKNLINLTSQFELHYALVERLLRLGWTDLVLRVLNNEFVTEEKIDKIKTRKQIIKLLSLTNNSEDKKEIVKILDIKLNNIVLIVNQDFNDGYNEKEIERKEFQDIGELKSYLIKKYDLPFNLVSEDLENLKYYDDYNFIIKQENRG